MENLQLGDMVLTGKADYEPVYAFGHQEKDVLASFVQIHKKDKQPLEVTPEHLVFLDGHANPVRADSIKAGDMLVGQDGTTNNVVTKVKTITKKGLYDPLTRSGTIAVDGVIASTYISLQDKEASAEYVDFQGGMNSGISHHDFVHMVLSPFRMLCSGVSSNMCTPTANDGMPLYVSKGLDFAKWADKQNLVVQGLLFLLVATICMACFAVEASFGPNLAPLAMLVAAVIWYKQNGIWKEKQV
ncbi:Protein hedgehog [Seminavis robusta]|uniref:Protein hedgehog n=1 Tax=Seminavis robusta TaxID=568900 RepID=A0A9N8E4Y7_9STRA|nr:Protein hedgehog [Seminavis robusta]|eukprot:Sro624_g177230.1 Protein hedgehog (243) ;mRNA; f:1702-2430